MNAHHTTSAFARKDDDCIGVHNFNHLRLYFFITYLYYCFLLRAFWQSEFRFNIKRIIRQTT